MQVHRPSVWVADDDESTLTFLSTFLSSEGFSVECFDSGEPVLHHLAEGKSPALLILDMRMPRVGGLEVLAHLEELPHRIPTIALSGIHDISTAVQAMRSGASDYLLKPVDQAEMRRSLGMVLGPDPLASLAVTSAEPPWASANKAVLRLKTVCDQVASGDVPVLILGESGVGKEVLARYIHGQSGRPEPFVRVNCAAVPADVLESEIFGYERSAFTGASYPQPGKIELAGGGTLLFDEIGEMGSLLQAKLLHFLEDGEYSRVGGTRMLRSEVRVLAATHKPLHRLVSIGSFREDLYSRLNVITVEVPPLRERREDILPLAHQFLDQYRDKYTSDIEQLPPKLAKAFEAFSWPGNIRQLEDAVKRFLLLPDAETAILELKKTEALEAAPVRAAGPSLPALSAEAAERTERDLVLRTLADVAWNRRRAAKRLNICYKTLLNKLHKWKLKNSATEDLGAPVLVPARVAERPSPVPLASPSAGRKLGFRSGALPRSVRTVPVA